MDIGRNDPCPCGSGKKYKKCCLGREEVPSSENIAKEYFAEVRKAMEGKNFANLDEAQAFLDDFTQQRNNAPLDEFQGLSSDQVYRLFHYPFDSLELIRFPSRLNSSPTAPVLTLFEVMVNAIGDNGLKPTATGNLPRKVVIESAIAYWGEEKYEEQSKYIKIRSENDFLEMGVTRLAAEYAGLIRKYKGKFVLTQKCRKILNSDGFAGIYPLLLKSFIKDYDWTYGDLYPEPGFIQDSFAFSLYLIHLYGDEWRSSEFYEDIFIQAFPIAVRQIPPMPLWTQEETMRNCYSLRFLKRFAAFMGLIELKYESDSVADTLISDRYELKKTPLLDEAVVFSI